VRGSGGLRSLRHGLPRFAEIVADVPPRCVSSNVDTPTGTRDLQFCRAGLTRAGDPQNRRLASYYKVLIATMFYGRKKRQNPCPRFLR
jgi:hypothetical protein